MPLYFPDYDEDNESCDFSTKHLLIGLGIVVLALALIIIFICIVIFCIAKGKDKVKLRALESSDKTMERYTKLLESLYAKVEKASNIEMEKIFEQIERYSSVLEDLARVSIGVFADDGSSQNSGTTPDGSGGITADNGMSYIDRYAHKGGYGHCVYEMHSSIHKLLIIDQNTLIYICIGSFHLCTLQSNLHA